MRKHREVLLLLLVLAVTVAAVILNINQSNARRVADAAISVTMSGESKRGLSREALEALPFAEREVTRTRRNGEKTQLTLRCVPLSTVLEGEHYTEVTAVAQDQFSALFTAEELAEPDNVLLYLDESGSTPVFSLAVCGDDFATRWVTDVRVLELN